MNDSRRDFLKLSGGLLAAGSILQTTGKAVAAEGEKPASQGGLTEHKLPPLPYAFDALEPHIDAKTMELHHDKHHAAYVKGLNAAEKALAEARAANDFTLIQHWSKQAAFHGAGHALHTLFWTVMAPAGNGGGGEPTGALAQKIQEDFGSFAAFKAQFTAAAKAVEGSGWGILAYRKEDKHLIVLQAENHQKLSPWNAVPLLVLDVWEHAYYLKYQNKRDEYVAAWWNVVNWPQVAALYEKNA